MINRFLKGDRLKLVLNQLLIISVYLIIFPIIQTYCIELNISKNVVDLSLIYKILPYILAILFISCIVTKRFFGIIAFVPAIYYLNLFPNDLDYYRYILLTATLASFLYTALIGHVRAFSFLFLAGFGSFVFDWYTISILIVSFLFTRFVVLVIKHNYTIFTTLGFRKSIIHLFKSFLYWSPLLIIIIPINRLQSNIDQQITSEIYRFTPVDTVQYHVLDELPDTLISQFKANSNITSVLFIDNARHIRNRDSRTDYPFSLPIVSAQLTPINELDINALSIEEQERVHTLLGNRNLDDYYEDSYTEIEKIKEQLHKLKRQDHYITTSVFKIKVKNVVLDIAIKKLEDQMKNIRSSIEYVDRLQRKNITRKVLVSTRINRHKTLPPNPAFNNIDLSLAEHEDTSTYQILTNVFPKTNSLHNKIHSIVVNDLVTDGFLIDSTLNLVQRNLLTSITNISQADSSIVLVMKDVSLPNPKLVCQDLQGNIEVTVVHLFLNFTNKLIRTLNEEAQSLNFSSIDQLSGNLSSHLQGAKQEGAELIKDQKTQLFKQINEHEFRTMFSVDKEFNAIFPEPLLETEDAKFWEVKKLIVNAMKRSVNQRYKAAKRNLKAKIDLKIKRIYATVRKKVDSVFMGIEQQYANAVSKFELNNIDASGLTGQGMDVQTMIHESIKGTVSEMTKSTIRGIRITFMVLFFYGLLGALSFAYLVIQTFMYVFARVTISEKNKVFATLNTAMKELPQGTIKACGDTYTIPADSQEVYYVSRNFEPSGMPPKFVVPYPKTSILPRIKSQIYSMNRIKMRNEAPVQFRAIGSCEFVEWTIADGEEVVFNYQNLVALTSTVRMKSVLNLRVTTLILGKLFHKVAVGPGKIILMSKGRPIISGEESANTSLAQNRILAWNGGTRFDIDSELNLVDIYLSGFYLKKMDEDLIVIDADAKGKASSGLIQYVKGLVWPF